MSVISTITCRIAIGKRYEDEGNESIRFHALMEECAAMLDSFFVSDHVPFSGWIDKLTGLCARLERNFKELDKFYQEVIEEHMDPNRKTSEEKDIVDILLELKKQRSSSIDISVDHIKAVLMQLNEKLFTFLRNDGEQTHKHC
ncbi:hypothetical protein VNO77_07201 [Canavalia gladiata]|uniref:Uncharacterized protein n=1 Tax=Canavalia gladiata TaxID=3824 RepID=A0AAN9M7E4_CANGL